MTESNIVGYSLADFEQYFGVFVGVWWSSLRLCSIRMSNDNFITRLSPLENDLRNFVFYVIPAKIFQNLFSTRLLTYQVLVPLGTPM